MKAHWLTVSTHKSLRGTTSSQYERQTKHFEGTRIHFEGQTELLQEHKFNMWAKFMLRGHKLWVHRMSLRKSHKIIMNVTVSWSNSKSLWRHTNSIEGHNVSLWKVYEVMVKKDKVMVRAQMSMLVGHKEPLCEHIMSLGMCKSYSESLRFIVKVTQNHWEDTSQKSL